MRRIFDCVEATEDIENGDFTIRLWLSEDDYVEDKVFDYSCAINFVQSMLTAGKTTKQIALDIADELETILNAVQVKDNTKPTKSGIMLYCVKF